MKVIRIQDDELHEEIGKVAKELGKRHHSFAEHCLKLGFDKAKEHARQAGFEIPDNQSPLSSHPMAEERN